MSNVIAADFECKKSTYWDTLKKYCDKFEKPLLVEYIHGKYRILIGGSHWNGEGESLEFASKSLVSDMNEEFVYINQSLSGEVK